MQTEQRLQYSLLFLRATVFIVFVVWILDKFLNPAHTAGVFESFYFIANLPAAGSWIIGTIQAVIVLAFVAGYLKRYSYGLVLLMHLVSTLSSFGQYLNPYQGPNILFFAAWPMLGACIALYLLRDEDRLFTVEKT